MNHKEGKTGTKGIQRTSEQEHKRTRGQKDRLGKNKQLSQNTNTNIRSTGLVVIDSQRDIKQLGKYMYSLSCTLTSDMHLKDI